MAGTFFQPGKAADRIYVAVRDQAPGADLRAHVEAMWARYAPICGDDPGHFVTDARANFHARTWEMYLACTLMDRGFCLRKPPRSGPDLLVDLGGRSLWIEATIAEPGTGLDAPRPWPMDGNMHPVDHDSRILRYAGAIRRKWKQSAEFAARGIVSESDPFVIAVNAGAIPVADVDGPVPDIVRTVLGLGHPQYVWRREAQTFGAPQLPERPSIRRAKGNDVELRFFDTPECQAISGVLFSALPIWNTRAECGGDLKFVHNRFARNPVPRSTFQFGEEWWDEPDGSSVRRRDWR